MAVTGACSLVSGEVGRGEPIGTLARLRIARKRGIDATRRAMRRVAGCGARDSE